MADEQQVNPYPPQYGGQGPQGAPADPSKFRLGGLISSIVQGSSGRNIGLGQGLSYAVDPQQRAIFNQGQQNEVTQGGIDHARQQDLIRHFQQNPDALNPDLIAHIALAHKAGFEAAHAGTEASSAARTENQNIADYKRFVGDTGETPGYHGMKETAGQETAATQEAQARAKGGAATATGISNIVGNTGVTPEYDIQQKELQQRGDIARGQLGLGQAELAEKGKEFGMQLPVEKARAFGGYSGVAAYQNPEEAHQGYEAAIRALYPDVQFGAGGGMPKYPNADHALEQEYRQRGGGGGQSTPTPSAPSTQGTGPGTSWMPTGGEGGSNRFMPPPGKGKPTSTPIQDLMGFNDVSPQQLQAQRALSSKFSPQDVEYLSRQLSLMEPGKARAMIQQLLQQK